jgi:transposase
MSPQARSKRNLDDLVTAAADKSGEVAQSRSASGGSARQLKVSRESVRRWSNQIAKQGMAGLKKAARAGRPPGLSAAELKKLETLLQAGPEKAGFSSGL